VLYPNYTLVIFINLLVYWKTLLKSKFYIVLEKMFASNSKSGVIAVDAIPNLLKEFNSDIDVNPEEFGTQVLDIPEADGNLIFSSF
jgi:hypothetical protein